MDRYSIYRTIDGELWIFVGNIQDEEMYNDEDLELLEELLLDM